MYKVLYRKWRPQVFADVVGQPQVTITLKNELMAGRIAHAYLFTGSRGTGKTTCAKILAKAVNCLDLHDGDPCGNCEICRGIESGSVMDIVEIDAASNNGVDNIRMLREEANFTPAAAKYRVYIIDEVHMLSTGAFNALLKTLEEPPEHVIFILATTEVHKLPATILSRCQRFDFRRIPPQEIAGRLTYVAEQENAVLEEQAGLLLARLADGALRDALSLLDQCLGRSKQVTLEVVQETVGLVGRDHLFALSEAVRGHDSSSALETIDRLYNASKDMARLCEELSAHYRGTKQALSTPLPEILHSLDTLQGALDKMYRGGDRRVEMEMALIKLCSPELDDSNAALVRRIEALERGIHRPGVSALKQAIPVAEEPTEPVLKETSEESSLQEVVSEQVAQASIAPPEISQTKKPLEEGAKRLAEWPEILRILKEYSVAISAAFTGSSAYVNGDYVLIDAKEMAFELLRKSAQRDKMREAIQQVTGRVYKLGPYRARKEEEAEVDPLLKLAGEAEEAGIPVTRT